MQKRIYIIGAGAIGKALAVFQKMENKDVILVRGSIDHLPAKKEVISVQNRDEELIHQEIEISTFSNLREINGVVVIATKTFANTEIAKKLAEKKGSFSIVLLQNGLNIEEPFLALGFVYRCVLFSTSQVLKDQSISFKSVSASPVGEIKNQNSDLQGIVSAINTAPFSFRAEPAIHNEIWDKVIINCAFNSLCPLLGTDNGIFFRNPEVTRLARVIIDECVNLAREFRLELDSQKIEEKLLFISQRASGQLISTLVDLNNKRRTEIESLNLEIACLSEKIGKPEMTNFTSLLGKMIQIKSELLIHSE